MMDRWIRLLAAACLSVFLMLSVSGCAGTADSGRPVARINQTVITQGDLDTYTALSVYREGYDPSEADVEQKERCLEEEINAEVIRQYYEQSGTEIYDDAYNAGKTAFLEDIQSNDAEFLDQNDISYQDLIDFFGKKYVTEKFFQETQSQHGPEEISAEARIYYDENLKDYAIEKEKRFSQILTKKKRQAVAVIERLDSGEDFDTIAREVSIDGNSAANGGDLGFFNKKETKERFGKGIFGMETGEYSSQPVRTADGYAVLRVTDSHDSGYQSYDEVAQDIVYSLYEKYNNERIDGIKAGMDIDLP